MRVLSLYKKPIHDRIEKYVITLAWPTVSVITSSRSDEAKAVIIVGDPETESSKILVICCAVSTWWDTWNSASSSRHNKQSNYSNTSQAKVCLSVTNTFTCTHAERDSKCFSLHYIYIQFSRYSDWQQAGRSGDRILVGLRFSATVQTGPWAHPASCTMGTGSFMWVESGRGMTLTPHPLLVLRSKNKVELHIYSSWGPSWPVKWVKLIYYYIYIQEWIWGSFNLLFNWKQDRLADLQITF
jgi:hypothetical protein